MKTETHYKIWCTEKKLYSKGGSRTLSYASNWGEKGKVWTNIGHLKRHLNQYKPIPDSWMIEELKVVTTKINQPLYKASSVCKPKETK